MSQTRTSTYRVHNILDNEILDNEILDNEILLLVVHHITPRSQEGSNKIENLALLCEGCHKEIHIEGWQDVKYDSKQEFLELVE